MSDYLKTSARRTFEKKIRSEPQEDSLMIVRNPLAAPDVMFRLGVTADGWTYPQGYVLLIEC